MKTLPLQKGIQFVEHESVLSVESTRVWLSSGTVPAEIISPLDYSPNAFLPLEPWRLPNKDEMAILQAEQQALSPTSSIGIFRVSEVALAPLRALGILEIKTEQQLSLVKRHPQYEPALRHLQDSLVPFFRSQDDLVVEPLISHTAGLPTVTYDYDHGSYIGLHLDSWDELPLGERQHARTRLSLNLGTDDRFLLFVNLTIEQLLDLLTPSKQEASLLAMTKTSREKLFFLRYPHYPVVRLRISPGEGYIAPTENMLHDGSSQGQKHLDLTLVMRGHLSLAG